MKLLRAKDVLIAPRMKFRDVAFQFRMPAGIPGDINRKWASIVESAVLPAAGATVPALYGLGVLIDATSGQIRLPAAGDTALYGVLARPFPTEGSGSALLGTSVPPTTEGIADLLIKGYMTVLLQNATAAKKAGAVFCRLQNPPANCVVGGFEAAADGANTVAVAGAYFMGPADSNGNVEIRFDF